MSSILSVQPSFEVVIGDLLSGVTNRETFYINVVPVGALQDGQSFEELITVELINGELSFNSSSGDFIFGQTGKNQYEATYKDTTYKIHTPKRSLGTNVKGASSFDVSIEQSAFVFGDIDGKLVFGDLTSGENKKSIENAHFSTITNSLFFPSGKVALTAGIDFQIKIWDASDGSNPRIFSGHKKRITDLGIIDRGRNFVSSGLDGLVKLWDCPSGQSIGTFQRLDSVRDGINTLLVCPTTEQLTLSNDVFAGYKSGIISQFDLNSHHQVSTFNSIHSEVVSLNEKTDKSLLVAYKDGTIAIWDKRNNSQPIQSFKTGSEIVSSSLTSEDNFLVDFGSGLIQLYDFSSNGGSEYKYDIIAGVPEDSGLWKGKGTSYFAISPSNEALYEI